MYLVPAAVDQAFFLASQAMAAYNDRAEGQTECARLQLRLSRKQAAEEAYRYIVENDGSVYTFGKTRQPVELLNHCIS